MSPILAMPTTMVAKITGVMIILISLMNVKASGLSCSPVFGANRPTSEPRNTATMTCTYIFL